MNQSILDKAFKYGKEAYKEAKLSAHKKLSNENQELNLNDSYQASEKGINLYIQAHELGFKIHGGILKMEKALLILKKQNPGFSDETYKNALLEAFVETR